MENLARWIPSWSKFYKSLTCRGSKVYSKHDQLAHSTSALAGLAVCTTTPAHLCRRSHSLGKIFKCVRERKMLQSSVEFFSTLPSWRWGCNQLSSILVVSWRETILKRSCRRQLSFALRSCRFWRCQGSISIGKFFWKGCAVQCTLCQMHTVHQAKVTHRINFKVFRDTNSSD